MDSERLENATRVNPWSAKPPQVRNHEVEVEVGVGVVVGVGVRVGGVEVEVEVGHGVGVGAVGGGLIGLRK